MTRLRLPTIPLASIFMDLAPCGKAKFFNDLSNLPALACYRALKDAALHPALTDGGRVILRLLGDLGNTATSNLTSEDK